MRQCVAHIVQNNLQLVRTYVAHIVCQVQIALDGGLEEKLVQVDLSAAINRVSHRCLLYKLRSIGVGG